MNILYVCSQGKMRSKTASHCTQSKANPTDYVGCEDDSERPIKLHHLEWADVIVCMEPFHMAKIRSILSFAGLEKKVYNWGIPDIYDYMDTTLVTKINSRYIDYFIYVPKD